MKILIIRHGDPDYDLDSLTANGCIEAELLSEKLLKENPVDVYVSPLGRAKKTAEYYLKKSGKEAITLDWIREFLAPVKDKNTSGYIWDLLPEYLDNNRSLFDLEDWKNHPLIKSGPVIEEYNKVINGFDNILSEHGYKRDGFIYTTEKGNEDTLMFFCHFGVECIILSHLLNISPIALLHGFCCAPSGVTTLYTEEREKGKVYFRCNGFGDISHLYKNDVEPSFAARFCETFENENQRH